MLRRLFLHVVVTRSDTDGFMDPATFRLMVLRLRSGVSDATVELMRLELLYNAALRARLATAVPDLPTATLAQAAEHPMSTPLANLYDGSAVAPTPRRDRSASHRHADSVDMYAFFDLPSVINRRYTEVRKPARGVFIVSSFAGQLLRLLLILATTVVAVAYPHDEDVVREWAAYLGAAAVFENLCHAVMLRHACVLCAILSCTRVLLRCCASCVCVCVCVCMCVCMCVCASPAWLVSAVQVPAHGVLVGFVDPGCSGHPVGCAVCARRRRRHSGVYV